MEVRPTGVCWCGCEAKVERGLFFVQGHDKKAEAKVIKDVFGTVPKFLAAFGYAPGGDELRSSEWTECVTRLAGLPASTPLKLEYVDPLAPTGPMVRTTDHVALAEPIEFAHGAVAFAIQLSVQCTVTVPFADLAWVYRDGAWIVRLKGTLVPHKSQFGQLLRYRALASTAPTADTRARVEFTEVERIILLNQLTILRAMEDGESRELDVQIEILRGGYELMYDELAAFQGVKPAVPTDQCKFVVHVLQLYRAIEHYKQAAPNDMAFAATPGAVFEGFDGNDEYEGGCMAFTRFLLLKQEKFAEQRRHESDCDGWNSHSPRAAIYRRMLAKWDELGRTMKLSREQAVELVAARMPE